MAQPTIQQTFEIAVRHHQAGRFSDAEQVYRQILGRQPTHVEAMHLLGVIAMQTGRGDVAVDLMRRAIGLRFNYPEAHSNLGNALRVTGALDEAIAACRQAIALKPALAEAHVNLGNALKDKGQLEGAIAAYRQAIVVKPNYADALSNLGSALKSNGQIDEAIAAYRRAIALRPNLPEAHNNLGNALKEKGELNEAIVAYRQAVALRPNYAEAYGNLGIVLKDKGEIDEAIAAHRKAIALQPNFADAHSNLGNALTGKGRLEEAIPAYRQAIALRPNLPEAHSNLGLALKDKGELDEAIAEHRQAIALKPGYAEAHQNLLFTLLYHPGYDAKAIAEEHRRWNEQHAEPLRKFIEPHGNSRDPERRLRIGYVSPDFRDHVVGNNLLPLLQRHDRGQFEIFCYGNVLRQDTVTAQFQKNADGWRNIVGVADERVARQIREDGIDILVDLALHTGRNSLMAFARKPAPVQVCYLGYCGSTGLSAMDYRLSDPYLDPMDGDLSYYSEKTVRLPRSYWCYQPGEAPAIAPLPAMSNGFITFGSLNNFAKISLAAVDLWSRILLAVPNSRFMIHALAGKHLDDIREHLERVGVAKDRLITVGKQPRMEYLQTYSQIDIALDPFPYGGGITTCDALWMGAAVVSLSGQSAVSRGARSILSNIGLRELVASTADQYVQIVVELANDRDRMDLLRREMRARMLASPLMDAEGFARDMEAVYRQMWRGWCKTGT